MFATDRDLLVLEPNLLRDVGWVGQRLVKGTGSISGTTLTMSVQDVLFDQAGVDAGSIAAVGGVPVEVLSRASGTELTVSLLRADAIDPAIPPAPVTDAEVSVWTFRPQLALVHGQVLRMLGIEPDEPDAAVTESSITNPGALRVVEALGAMHLVMASAAAVSGPGSPAWERAAQYRARFAAERQRVAARIDLDGDGAADATRRLNVVQFLRG